MIKINYPLLLLIVFFVRVYDASAQNIPILKDIRIGSYVTFNSDDNLFNYAYEMTNPKTNTGQIKNVQIDISKPADSRGLSSQGLEIQEGVDYKGSMIISSFEDAVKQVVARLNRTLVPVGARPPMGWSAGLSASGTISWGSEEKKYRIMPGQTLTGYALISKGLPAIRNISVHPKWVLVVEGYVSEEDLGKSKKIEEEITFKGKTIGPTAPPADFKPDAFLDYIIDLKHQTVSLGWIKNEGIVKSLDAKLDNAKKKLDEGQNGAAKNILNAFINEVEAQGCATYEDCPPGKQLTSEAYALLKYNAQYLINNLK